MNYRISIDFVYKVTVQLYLLNTIISYFVLNHCFNNSTKIDTLISLFRICTFCDLKGICRPIRGMFGSSFDISVSFSLMNVTKRLSSLNASIFFIKYFWGSEISLVRISSYLKFKSSILSSLNIHLLCF